MAVGHAANTARSVTAICADLALPGPSARAGEALVLRRRHRQPGRRQRLGVAVAQQCRHPADGDQLADPAAHHPGEVAKSAVHHDPHVERATGEGGVDGGGVERIGVHVLDERFDVRALVAAGVQDRDAMAPIEQPPHDMRPGGAGPTDDER